MTNQPGSLTGAVVVRPELNVGLMIVLLLLCLVPGIIYILASLRSQTFPLSVQFFPVEGGTRVMTGGSGQGLTAATTAALCLPTVDRPNGWQWSGAAG
jgi:hypothetical protein